MILNPWELFQLFDQKIKHFPLKQCCLLLQFCYTGLLIEYSVCIDVFSILCYRCVIFVWLFLWYGVHDCLNDSPGKLKITASNLQLVQFHIWIIITDIDSLWEPQLKIKCREIQITGLTAVCSYYYLPYMVSCIPTSHFLLPQQLHSEFCLLTTYRSPNSNLPWEYGFCASKVGRDSNL